MGPSGSGKSTLFNMIGALDKPSRGEVRVAGHNLTVLTRRQLAHFRGHYIGYVFQNYNLLPAYDALTNVAMPLLFGGVSPADAKQRARIVLDRVGLGDRLSHRPDEMSGGQQQRVAIARALVHEPRLLVCDEPTSALDAENGRITMELISNIAVQPDRAVIVVTHDSRVYSFADRIANMEDGRIELVEVGPRA
jgi:putative ABC transport system ATP-binding protein